MAANETKKKKQKKRDHKEKGICHFQPLSH